MTARAARALTSMCRSARLWALALLATLAAAQVPAPVSARVALVIGNAAYPGAPLANPANDARAVGETLRRLGFDVIELRDGSREQMLRSIERLQRSLTGRQGVGLLYYAGHGVQIETRNFMIPVDARLRSAADVRAQAVDIAQVIDALKGAGARLNILVLDACRDNPFGNLGGGRGLAPLDAPSGTFLAYATAPGNVAVDGAKNAPHGLYTYHLLQELARPDTRIEDVFKRVRFAVRQASGGKQIPWESTSLEEDFSFNDGRIVAARPPSAQQIRVEFNEEVAQWDKIKHSTRPEPFYEFLLRYPSGALAEAAHARLNELTRPVLTVQGAGSDGSDQRYTVSRFREGDVFEERMTTSGGANAGVTTLTHRVRKVAGDRVEVTVEDPNAPEPLRQILNVYNGAGGLVSAGPELRFDPPQYLVPGGLLQVGMQWKTAHRHVFKSPDTALMPDVHTLALGHARVVARERVKVPAGEFDAFRVELSSVISVTGQPESTSTSRYWLVPSLPVPVRSEMRLSMPKLADTSIVKELTRVSRQR